MYAPTRLPEGEDLLQTLSDAGCPGETVAQYLAAGGDRARQQQLLLSHRDNLLAALHRAQRRIDCLDYLLYRLQQAAQSASNSDGKEGRP